MKVCDHGPWGSKTILGDRGPTNRFGQGTEEVLGADHGVGAKEVDPLLPTMLHLALLGISLPGADLYYFPGGGNSVTFITPGGIDCITSRLTGLSEIITLEPDTVYVESDGVPCLTTSFVAGNDWQRRIFSKARRSPKT